MICLSRTSQTWIWFFTCFVQVIITFQFFCQSRVLKKYSQTFSYYQDLKHPIIVYWIWISIFHIISTSAFSWKAYLMISNLINYSFLFSEFRVAEQTSCLFKGETWKERRLTVYPNNWWKEKFGIRFFSIFVGCKKEIEKMREMFLKDIFERKYFWKLAKYIWIFENCLWKFMFSIEIENY